VNILFVNYHDFSSNSAIHIYHYANHLVEKGLDCGVCVPRNKESIEVIGTAKFAIYNFRDLKKIKFRNGAGPDLIHAWTPREIVGSFTKRIAEHYVCPYIVHLEDNEEAIVEAKYKVKAEHLRELPEKIVTRLMDKHYSHPIKYKEFLNGSNGVTTIIQTLLEFKPSQIPGKVVWPGYDKTLFHKRSVDIALKKKLGIPDGYHTIVYSGNVHHSNQNEVYSLYLAVAALNRKGIHVKLVRTGRDFVHFKDSVISNAGDCFVELGFIDREMLPKVLSLADAFVQPGKSDAFNDYRFPSKLPEFFAMGKPVILPKTNIGNYLTEGNNCILLQEGSAVEIADKLEILLKDSNLRERIGENGRLYAENHFDWSINTEVLYEFYRQIILTDRNSRGTT
jgi:glycosyltransferase involved in cell wall biosynthesis